MIGVLIPLLLSCTLYIMHACMHRKSLQTCPTFVTLWTVACQAPLSMRFSRQEYWKWVAMPTSRGSFWPRDQICSSCGSHIAGRLFTAEPLKKPHYVYIMRHMFISVQFTQSCDSLRPHGLQHVRPPRPSSTPRARPNSCPLSQWCHPTISSSVIPFSSHHQSFPASGSFQMSQFFASGDKSIGVSVSHQSFQWIFRTDLIILFIVFIGKLTVVRLSIDIVYVKVTDVLQETEFSLLFSDLIYAADLLPHYFTLLSSYILLYSFLWPLTMLMTPSLYDPFSSIGPLSVRMLQASVSSHLLIMLLK